MFIKELEKSQKLIEAQAIDRRIPINHIKRPELEKKLRILISGYQGEKTLNYYLSLLPKDKYHIYQGLRLPGENSSFFQMDGLLKSSKMIFILETKNNSGTLTIDKHQLTQEYNGNKEIYQNPVTQVNRHKILLQNFFIKYKISTIPIENLVVISKSSAELKIAPGYHEAEKKVCKASNLLKELERIEKYHNKEVFDKPTMNKVKNLFLKKHTPLKSNLLQELGIEKSEILTGVGCPHCGTLPMEYGRKGWKCPKCLRISKDAHIDAINDYFILIKPTITVSELREFLHLPSNRVAAYILSLLNLLSTGEKKGRVYHKPQ